MTQPSDILDDLASRWKPIDRLDSQLLRAICRLSTEHPEQANDGFTSIEIVEVISQMRHGGWSDSSDPVRQSRDVRNLWKKLKDTWDTKYKGITQRLSDEGINEVPLLKKTEGGGSGYPSRYRIEWKLQKEADLTAVSLVNSQEPQNQTYSIKYICEDIVEANPLARIFARGFSMSGWRKWVMLTAMMIPLFLVWLVFVVVIFNGMVWAVNQPSTIVPSLFGLIIIAFSVWKTIGPLFDMVTDKIVLAPWWMQSDDNDCLLEHRSPPRYSDKSVKAVRYTSKCPICNGTVSAKSGGIEFLHRLIGKCENSPREHIYTFDHVTRQGKSLR